MTNRIELLPGVWLNTVQTDRFKTGCFSINLLRPLRREEAALNALTPSVLLRGCRSHPDMQTISQRLDELYGAGVGTLIRKKGEVQTVGLYADFLEDAYANGEPVFSQMMEFLRELLFAPCMENGGLLEEYVEGEALNLTNAIASRVNEKRAYAVYRLLQNMCGGEAYAVPRLGEADTLEGVTGRSLYTHWQDLLATSPIELFYLGQQPKEKVATAMLRLLEGLPRKGLVRASTEKKTDVSPAKYISEPMDVTQGKLAMGFRTDITVTDSRYPALLLLNAVYGAGSTSKLFLQIREEQSLCYYANSSMDKFKGIMLVGAGIEFEDYQIAVDGIVHQLDLCKQGEITEEELETARQYLLSSLRTGNDSPGRMDDYAVGQAIAGRTDSMEELADQLKTVTMEQVVAAANTLWLDTVYFLKGVEA